ncbi:hypothetical protein HELRODRAFT_83384 [Helobdella robusta]|uniref:Uncharacterized protein n=1 Tax=Helobdella robusta TaxID=6412 RepID=T1G550_HELRO|nr:hypothetical protein HELRODRAFT_83384 [Helobdella robusta]ESO00233.1 hypothetical protein HELRODRAFT_83384 [Helobdella robusta]
MSAIEKPVLRGFLKQRTIKHAVLLAGLAILTTSSVKIFVGEARKKRFEQFYKTYDQDKDYVRMREAGVFRSVPPKGNNEL